MGFPAIIIAYIVSISLSGHGEPATRWAQRWHKLLSSRKWDPRLVIVLFALLPAVVLGIVLGLIGSRVLAFVVSVALLILAFKSGDQPESVADYRRKTEAGDDQGAWQLAVDELGLERQMYEPGEEGIEEGIQAGLAYLYLERFFVHTFWYIAFGAPGILLVWLVTTAVQGEEADAFCHQVKQALYWIPVRLMTFTLALMGHFAHGFQVWLDQVKDFERDDRMLLVSCLKSALGPVNEDNQLEETLSLLKRTQLAWLVGIALMFIFGF
ncbi:regulatory signaling modulator protein AmpE [Reinekea blandensis]|uniref:Membrane protein required for beta-lactamase induction n=1 Tax=Reinekea blandensis MED297 TaxID=314283 RepID=A4BKE4_9GAMM|nr:regulatory signaling modulator protein AmpE [Reinekea blandensis]EAR07391.1 Membrane protein required for beta-lactamase induction [Reinekea sp. MED297] [Reinekea blandensis MED297]